MNKKLLFFIFLCTVVSSVFAQGTRQYFGANRDSIGEYEYALPIFGNKLHKHGIEFPLPLGASVNYVHSELDLDISEFGMSIGDANLDEILNDSTLNFDGTRAGTNGTSFRVDVWVLPFLNVYGLGTIVNGYTDVAVSPTFEKVEIPTFRAKAVFEAQAFGFGGTLAYGVNDWFTTVDVNHSWTSSEILDENVGFLITSARIGRLFQFNNKMNSQLAIYSGIMHRKFTDAHGNTGTITINEVIPGMEPLYREWYNGLTPVQKRVVDNAEEKVQEAIGDENFFNSPVDYHIKKDLVSNLTWQVGGSYDINKHIALRAEGGFSKHQRMFIGGLNYRFGIKKSTYRK